MNQLKSDEVNQGKTYKEEKESTLEKNDTNIIEMKTPDGGYGWLVVLGCFLAHTVTGGIERSDGLFFLQFLERFNKSAQLTAWPGAIMSTMNLCIGPVASGICNRYSVRTSVMLAGILMSAGCILNGFANNFYFLFFSHSFLLGVGRGLSYAPGLIIVAMYFDKRRGLATGIGSSGVGLGTFLLVPITQFLFDNFGFQGTFLIFGGIALNMNVCAMLYRPLSMHYAFIKHSTKQVCSVNYVDASEVIIQSETIPEVESMKSWRSNSIGNQRHNSQEMQSLASIQNRHNKEQSHVDESVLHSLYNCLTSNLKLCFPTEVREKNDDISRKLCHFYLLKNTSFLCYCLSIWFFTMAMKAAFMFIPALVKFKGNSDAEASLVLSITGAVDSLAIILAGFILDKKRLRPYRPFFYNLIMFAMAGVAFILPSMDSLESLLVLCCIYGLFTGAYVSQKSVILVDILGIQHMANSLGILICFQSVGTLLGPPLSGALKDHFGTFTEAFYLGGGFMVAAGIMMLISNVFLSINRRKGQIYK